LKNRHPLVGGGTPDEANEARNKITFIIYLRSYVYDISDAEDIQQAAAVHVIVLSAFV